MIPNAITAITLQSLFFPKGESGWMYMIKRQTFEAFLKDTAVI